MGGREHQEVRLEPGDFFQADVRPILLGIHNGDSASEAQGIRNEGVLANRDERLMPDNEENTFGRRRSEVLLQIRKMMFHFGGDGSACVRCAQDIGELLEELAISLTV